ncbi:hypothetical protein BC832DRAFT_548404 [Gaertneriomyces semiglobifer]|nr:hypothetical protein BC832DRAFT_548404 [Gaertneriomyces semiglobifer]
MIPRTLAFAYVASLISGLAVHAQSPPLPAPTVGSGKPEDYPNFPAQFPSTNQLENIPEALLKTPLVQDALKTVLEKVPAALLSLPPSQHVTGPTVTYPGGEAAQIANCHWPHGHCTRATDTAQYKADVYVCKSADQWGLTYDDGPTVVADGAGFDTADIRNHLAKLNGKATFFVSGAPGMLNTAEILTSYEAGHEIASHTWTHHPLTTLTNEQIVAEVMYTDALIFKAIGKRPQLIRPPYGDLDDRVRAVLTALGYRSVTWTSAPDRDTHDAGGVLAQVVNTVKTWFVAQPGFISLQHDISTNTSEMAVRILEEIEKTPNFPLKLMTVAECTGVPAYFGDKAPDAPAGPSDDKGKSPNSTEDNAGLRATAATGVSFVALVGSLFTTLLA